MCSLLTASQIYAQLEALVLPVLEQYHADLTTHDRRTLSTYTGPFLLSYRKTGTHLLLLGEAKEFLIAGDPRPAAQQIQQTYDRKRAEVSWDYQTHFVHFTGREFKALTRAEALQLVDACCAQTLAALTPQKPALAAY